LLIDNGTSVAGGRVMNNLRVFTSLFGVFGSAAVTAGCTDSGDASLRVENRSDYAIIEIHVTPVGKASWGRNLLDGDTLEPGESMVLGADCGIYDALLVDEAGVDCQVDNINLCLNDARWIIRNNTCTVFGAAKAARDAAAAAKPSTPSTSAPKAGAP
jgi:hypothetical protein